MAEYYTRVDEDASSAFTTALEGVHAYRLPRVADRVCRNSGGRSGDRSIPTRREHVEAARQYGFQPPRDWGVSNAPPPGFKYHAVTGKLDSGVAGSLIFAEEAQWRTLKDQMKAAVTVMAREGVMTRHSGAFETSTGTLAERVIGEALNDQRKKNHWLMNIFQSPPGQRLSATCSARVDEKDGDEIVGVCDASMKTMRFLGKTGGWK